MLRFLSIRNLAVIDRLEVEFEPGLNVLTGETGAGKSILVGAVGLLVGGRASADLVRTGEEPPTVEAIFETPDGGEAHRPARSVGAGTEPRLRRRRARDERGAARVCCGAWSISMASTSTRCYSIPSTHLDLLDAVRGAWQPSASEVAAAFARARRCEPNASASSAESARKRRGRVPVVPARRDRSSRAEAWRRRRAVGNAAGARQCRQAAAALFATPTLRSTKETRPRCQPSGSSGRRSGSSPHSMRGSRRISMRGPRSSRSSRILRSSCARTRGAIDAPGAAAGGRGSARATRASEKEARPVARRCPQKAEALRRERHESSTRRSAPPLSRRRWPGRAGAYLEAATTLSSAAPRRQLSRFTRALEKSLGELAMSRTRCEVRFVPAADEADWSDRGHRGRGVLHLAESRRGPEPLARIASGGELSRMMLALKTLASTDAPGKTLIFDEVDAGIGGAVADVVGARLQRLGDDVSRCSALLTFRKSPRTGRRTTASRKSIRTGRTVDGRRTGRRASRGKRSWRG